MEPCSFHKCPGRLARDGDNLPRLRSCWSRKLQLVSEHHCVLSRRSQDDYHRICDVCLFHRPWRMRSRTKHQRRWWC
ncbi:hypothetical protein I7I53_00564 [Histoplasma capsulatum var. duboisii H88]|uniref:Uncharacterized protein n=1 Tax=Ajellomyces capsulatus (strain H88) TaxID=544711 RepID=A0A8A1LHE9_AJEC8|nr:hypothetical protein I7I53_00564 [Histoplasma capsulatum var. duboisii H88]